MTQSEEWYLFAVLLTRQRYIWKNKNFFYHPTLYYYEVHDYTCTSLILNILFTSVCNLKISHSVFLWCTVLHVNPVIQVHPQSMTNPSQCIDMPQTNLSCTYPWGIEWEFVKTYKRHKNKYVFTWYMNDETQVISFWSAFVTQVIDCCFDYSYYV